MIMLVIFIFLLLTSNSSGEASCGQFTRGSRVVYDLRSENNFGLWYKMEMKYTQVQIRYTVNLWHVDYTTFIESQPVWSNIEEYRGITSAGLKNERRGITSIYNVTITGNATMEWILCKRLDSCPVIPARDISTSVTVLVVLLILLVVVMVICTAYILHLRNIISQIVVSQFLSNNVSSGGNIYCNPYSLHGASPVSHDNEDNIAAPVSHDNIYDEWAEIPPPAPVSPHSKDSINKDSINTRVFPHSKDSINTRVSPHSKDSINTRVSPHSKDSINSVRANTSQQQDLTNGRFSPHNSENDIYEVIADIEEQQK